MCQYLTICKKPYSVVCVHLCYKMHCDQSPSDLIWQLNYLNQVRATVPMILAASRHSLAYDFNSKGCRVIRNELSRLAWIYDIVLQRNPQPQISFSKMFTGKYQPEKYPYLVPTLVLICKFEQVSCSKETDCEEDFILGKKILTLWQHLLWFTGTGVFFRSISDLD